MQPAGRGRPWPNGGLKAAAISPWTQGRPQLRLACVCLLGV